MLTLLLDSTQHDLSYIPLQRGITAMILSEMESLLNDRMRTQIDERDLSRLSLVQVGPPQHSPKPVAIYLYENELGTTVGWRHEPDGRSPVEQHQGLHDNKPIGRLPLGRLELGGVGRYQRAVTMELRVTGDVFDYAGVTQSMVGEIAAVVGARAMKVLSTNYQSFAMLTDSFGEGVVFGPYWGKEWAAQQEGQALRIIKYLQVWFRTQREYFTLGG